MKNFNLLYIVLAILLFSCKGSDSYTPYVYETNPHYSFGYVQFYGKYYQELLGNQNNIISVSLFSDSLYITEEGSLEGFGQYLYLEDVFVNPTDTLFQYGSYTISSSGEPFTIEPGKNDTIDNEIYTYGATITYFEENQTKSVLKLITEGTVNVSKIGSRYTISFDLKTNDMNELKGNFVEVLPQYNESLQSNNPITRSQNRFKITYN